MTKLSRVAVVFMVLLFVAFADEDAPPSSNSHLSSPPRKDLGLGHTWPAMKFGWRIVVGSIVAFAGAAFGSVGGVGAGMFIPMLNLIIGFDAKTSPAISKCMVMATAVSTFTCTVRKRHPGLDMPLIDYDLALLFQPALVLGISIGVMCNTVFPSWLITAIFIVVCLVTSGIAIKKGINLWNIENIQKENHRKQVTNMNLEIDLVPDAKTQPVSLVSNIQWKKLGYIVGVWISIVVLQVVKSHTKNCSSVYWAMNILQIPVVSAASGYQVLMLYKGKHLIASQGSKGSNFTATRLISYCLIAVFAGSIGGLVGLGGGVIMAPVFLTMGVPPEVSSATSMFAVMFSSSISVVEYYLLKRFPIKYTLFFVVLTAISALVGSYIVKKVVKVIGRTSILIFMFAISFLIGGIFMVFQGITNAVNKVEHHKYMGFESLCSTNS